MRVSLVGTISKVSLSGEYVNSPNVTFFLLQVYVPQKIHKTYFLHKNSKKLF